MKDRKQQIAQAKRIKAAMSGKPGRPPIDPQAYKKRTR